MAYALGLDIGRNMGWAAATSAYLANWQPRTLLEGPRASNAGLECGTWDLGKHADHDALFAQLFKQLQRVHLLRPIDVIFYEASGGNYQSEAAVWIQIGLAAVIRCWCRLQEPRVESEKINNQTVKKHAALSGRADKLAMIAAANRLGWRPDSEHSADALFVLDVGLTQWQRRPG